MITIAYPKVGQGRVEVNLPYVKGLSLKQYCKQVPGLIATRFRCHVIRPNTRERLRFAHVPEDGEVIAFELSGR